MGFWQGGVGLQGATNIFGKLVACKDHLPSSWASELAVPYHYFRSLATEVW